MKQKWNGALHGYVPWNAMVLIRTLALFAAVTSLRAGVAMADPPARTHPPPSPGIYSGEQQQGRDRGVLHGRVLGVNFQTGVLSLDTGGRRVNVIVLPSTSIFRGKSGYASLSDIARGNQVDVYVSQIAGRLIAQIIRIK